jgi:hypothetical protein
MKHGLIGGVVLAVVVALFSIVFAAAGMHKNPALGWVFPVLGIASTVGVVIGTFRKTRDAGNRYGGQLLVGIVIAVVAAVLLFVNSYLFTTTIFPNYLDEVRVAQEELLATQPNQSPQQIDAQRKALDIMLTPKAQAGLGAVMTVITTGLVTLIAAIFLRKKD